MAWRNINGVQGTFRRVLLQPAAFCTTVGACGFVGAAYVSLPSTRGQAADGYLSAKKRLWQRHDSDPIDFIKNAWSSMTRAQKVLGWITAVNVGVYAMWKVPRLQGMIRGTFLHQPFSGKLRQLVGCHVSHQSLPHLGFNMLALWSFGTPVAHMMGTEQFLGFALGAGMSSAFASQLHSVVTGCSIAGLGASGVLMGVIGVFAMTHPNATVYVPFLPFISGTALQALGCIVAVDVLGIALGWRMLGHAAHLGGSAFGVAYCYFHGDILFQRLRRSLYQLQKSIN
eukprot:m.251719 g.251719  ORF g.251719 m.251719 type:complete len:284 (-) comp19543_c0_seq6:486-1337(-)